MPARIYQVDSNHIGIRIAVLAVFVVTSIIGVFVIVPGIINLLGLRDVPQVCLAGIGGVALGAGIAWWSERVLIKVWPSGDTLQMDSASLVLKRRRSDPITIQWAERINVLSWHFVVRRGRSWVPRGWLCLACHLHQDETTVIPYTFINPSDARDLSQWRAFEELISQEQRPGLVDDVHQVKPTPEQAQLRSAEKERWMGGCELRAEDFVELVSRLDERLAHWPG